MPPHAHPPSRALPIAIALLAATPLLTGCLGAWSGGGQAGPAGETGGHPAGPVRILGASSAHVGETLHFRAQGPEGSAFYFWDFGDGTGESGVDRTEVAHAFSQAGAYPVRVTRVVGGGAQRAEASLLLGVGQVLQFEGTVAKSPVANLEHLGSPTFEADFPVREDLAGIAFRLLLTRADPAPAALDAPAVRFRLYAPASGAPQLVLDKTFQAANEATAQVFTVPADEFPQAGNATLNLVAERGIARFRLDVETTYLSG